ncbi:1-(5-phosphoribosyl)-5-[(5-phosphoribosylamino)methylideneamino]imidazole-4-carboxamide isomerase [Candidatus Spongiihabitans sp.]|uniref:1-(5-phosphoribosyl)-5-[(5- phosphoribosylamino)methylideneamino]imidazole-4- carboxamide isomerase n=1 Tax=Candidatus Spongiihabitans sp. TaxID=3101308 RepID=UPI003C7B3AAE
MLLIPAIDIKDGKCVRLRQGDMNQATVFADDPVSVAQRWVDAGARRLHIVDLDGAIKGEPVNADIVRRIAERHPALPIQIGGGIRDQATVDSYLQAGVRYVIMGTQAINQPRLISDLCTEYPDQVMVGLDAKDDKVATDGWSKLTKHDVIDLARRFDDADVAAIIYTDIARDGMMQGVNIEATAALAQAVNTPVIASGGIRNIDDIKKLAARAGIVGAIAGRALYEGALDFAQGQCAADEISGAGGFGG